MCWRLFLALIFLDQLSKHVADSWGLVDLNAGVAFGIGNEFSHWAVVGVLCIFLSVVIWLIHEVDQFHSVGSVILLAGGVSNLIDRVWWGAVRDWLPVPGMTLSNNLADWMIVVGVSVYMTSLVGSRLRST